MDGARTKAELLVVEYEQLKEEQRLRIGTRDNLIYATLGALTVAIAGTVQLHVPATLMLLPPVCVILGWTYLVNDDRITAIGLHIQHVIAPELAILVGSSEPVFDWERMHRADPRRRLRKSCQLGVDLLVFCLTGLTALIVVWARVPLPFLLLVLSVAETAALALLAFHFLRQATTVTRAAVEAG